MIKNSNNHIHSSRIKTTLNRENNELFFKIIHQLQNSNVQQYNDLPYESMISSIRNLRDSHSGSKSPNKNKVNNPTSKVSQILNSINLNYNSKTIEKEEEDDNNKKNKSVNKKRVYSLNLNNDK